MAKVDVINEAVTTMNEETKVIGVSRAPTLVPTETLDEDGVTSVWYESTI